MSEESKPVEQQAALQETNSKSINVNNKKEVLDLEPDYGDTAGGGASFVLPFRSN